MQTSICAWLSLIALVGVALNALFGWWWADPLAALAMTPIITIEGYEGIRSAASRPDEDTVRRLRSSARDRHGHRFDGE